MFEQLKKVAVEQAMKLMSSPTVGKVLSDPRFTNALAKGFEMHGMLRERIERQVRAVADGLQLASRDQVGQLEQKLEQVSSRVEQLAAKLNKPARKRTGKKAPAKKNNAPAATAEPAGGGTGAGAN